MLLSSGQACGYAMKGTHAKYGKFAYSTAYGFSVPPGGYTLEQFALDSTLGLSDDGGEVWKTRRTCESAGIETFEDTPVLVSTWKPFKDVEIQTLLISPTVITPNWHIRAHKIVSQRGLQTAEGSFAIRDIRKSDGRALQTYDPATFEGTMPKIIGNYDLSSEQGTTSRQVGAYTVSKGAVGIVDLLPDEGKGGYAMIVNADPNSNLVESKTVIPTLMDTIKPGETRWYVNGIYAKPSGNGVEPASYLDGWDRKPEIPQWLKKRMGS
jgi:hypothetical protein